MVQWPVTLSDGKGTADRFSYEFLGPAYSILGLQPFGQSCGHRRGEGAAGAVSVHGVEPGRRKLAEATSIII